MKYAPALILGAGAIYLIEYTDLVTAPVNDPTGFLDNQLNGVDPQMAQDNMSAFLATIRKWESSNDAGAYTMLFGGGHFSGFSDHPRIAVKMKNGQYSTAAGAYQILAVSNTPNGPTRMNTWDRIKVKLKLSDFSPASQDAAAIELIKERGAYYDVIAGRFDLAVSKINKEWASVPGSPYGQPRATLEDYRQAYADFGGTINV